MPGVVVYLTFTLMYGGIITHSSLLVNCTLSSLAKSPNQCCKLSLKSLKGVDNMIFTLHYIYILHRYMFLECFTGMYIPSGVIFNHEVWSVAID